MITKITPSQSTIKKHILAIEDDASIARMLTIMIGDRYYLTIIESAEEALRYLKVNPARVDLILLDNMLPGMSGLKLLAIIKEDDTLRGIPVIIQSGDPDVLSSKSSAILADQILLKPYTKEKLLEAIAKIINQS